MSPSYQEENAHKRPWPKHGISDMGLVLRRRDKLHIVKLWWVLVLSSAFPRSLLADSHSPNGSPNSMKFASLESVSLIVWACLSPAFATGAASLNAEGKFVLSGGQHPLSSSGADSPRLC